MAPKILVIDDDENTLWLVSTLLQHNDFEVIKSASATEGLDIARDQQPDLILLDVMMPDMDGWEVCRRLRETSAVRMRAAAASRSGELIKASSMRRASCGSR